MNNLRPTSGAGIVILTLSFVSSTGIYLIMFTSSLRGTVLAGVISVLIGLLTFRMVFPSQGKTPQPEKTGSIEVY